MMYSNLMNNGHSCVGSCGKRGCGSPSAAVPSRSWRLPLVTGAPAPASACGRRSPRPTATPTAFTIFGRPTMPCCPMTSTKAWEKTPVKPITLSASTTPYANGLGVSSAKPSRFRSRGTCIPPVFACFCIATTETVQHSFESEPLP